MKITAVTVTDWKRIKDVRITPDADSFLILIGGKNAAGKSSLLDALTYAFGGGKALPAEAVRKGAEKAEILCELDGGTYTIRRIVPADGEPKIEILGPDGKIAKAQAWLDKLVAARFLDPLAFLAGEKAEDARRRRDTLLRAVGVDLDAFEAERRKVYDERTGVGRVITAAQAELGRLPAATPRPPEARSQAAIRADLDAVAGEQRKIADIESRRRAKQAEHRAAEERVEHLRTEIARLQAALAKAEGALATIERDFDAIGDELVGNGTDKIAALDARAAALREESLRAETLARWEATHEALAGRRRAAEDQIARHVEERDRLTAAIEAIDQRKATALAAADMPVPELGVTEAGLTIGGVPFEQASQSERFRVALAIAMKMSPNLRDVWIKDGSLFDDDTLADLHAQAMFADCRLWVERVGERDEGAIVIRDGRVASAGKAA